LVSKLKLKKTSGGYLETDDISTPILLISKKTCFVTHREEIKAINEMANQYKGKIEFIVLYWDRKSLVKKATRGFNRNVNIVYVNERDNKLDNTLSSIKNSFGVPYFFYITESKQLSNIDRKFYLKNLKRSTKKEFYDNTYNDITELLLENEISKKQTNISTRNN
jgi:Zn-dependent peptidase ImmA (M78 family)